jgi:predicted PurR-regulated permease PerM
MAPEEAGSGPAAQVTVRTTERVLRIHPRTVVGVAAILLALALALWLVWLTRQILVWLLVAIFLAVAIDPLVGLLQRHGIRNRGAAVTIGVLLVVGALVGLAWLVVPPLIREAGDFVEALPGYVEDIASGRGPLGFLEEDYQIVERVRQATEDAGAAALFGLAGGVASFATTVLTAVAAVVTIVVMTIFLLLGGPRWMEGFYSVVPEDVRPRWRALGADLYRSVGGYVRGNLAISLIAGGAAAAVLFPIDAPNATALCVIVALFDLIPLVGATIGAAIVGVVLVVDSPTKLLIWVVFVVVYQQLENHVIQPVVYGRTVQLPAFAVLLAVLIGASLAGVLGALAAIPVASAIQIIGRFWLAHRRERASPPAPL